MVPAIIANLLVSAPVAPHPGRVPATFCLPKVPDQTDPESKLAHQTRERWKDFVRRRPALLQYFLQARGVRRNSIHSPFLFLPSNNIPHLFRTLVEVGGYHRTS